jgi:hypothetical protein
MWVAGTQARGSVVTKQQLVEEFIYRAVMPLIGRSTQ